MNHENYMRLALKDELPPLLKSDCDFIGPSEKPSVWD